jgi:hypothetical protein
MNSAADTAGTDSRAFGELFVNIVQHLSSCSDIGVEMIAANYGVNGTGFTFWDQGTIGAGHRSWAVFRFHSASMGKFDCMVFVATGSSVSNDPMRPGSFASTLAGSGRGNVGIAFACHPSGSNTGSADGPWNGSYSLTSASIGISGAFGGIGNSNPVWKLNSEGKGAFFPRSLQTAGTYSGSRNYMSLLHEDSVTQTPLRAHIIVSEDSLTILTDASADTSYRVTHFGSYTPRAGITPYPEAPYVMISNGGQGNSPWGNTWTTTNGVITSPGATSIDGACAHPTLLSGSRLYGLALVLVNNTIAYNNFVNNGAYERFPIWVVISEGSDNGFLGTLNHLSYGFGMASQTVTPTSSSAAFGTATAASGKILIPWSGSQPGFLNGVRTGRAMNFDI